MKVLRKVMRILLMIVAVIAVFYFIVLVTAWL